MPYYLHILDKVKGAMHFSVDLKEAKQIYFRMKQNLPGYLLPKLVIETHNGKVNVAE
jgi:L-lysine 2,3-aminomutase